MATTLFGEWWQVFKLSSNIFMNTAEYWDGRYSSGGTSGGGSRGERAEFKAQVINDFIEKEGVSSVLDFGCGDGYQGSLIEVKKYTGEDISKEAINICKENYKGREFRVVGSRESYAELGLSLDVIFHLLNDEDFESYMKRLFKFSRKWVIIYSSNTDKQLPSQAGHLNQHRFTSWVKAHQPEGKLVRRIKNKYPYKEYGSFGSISNFYIYEKNGKET